MKRITLCILLFLAAPALAGAQQPAAPDGSSQAVPAAQTGQADQAQDAGQAGQADQDPAALLQKAVAQAKAGNMKAAVALLEPLRNRPDTPPQILAMLGALYLQVHQPGDALAVLEPMAKKPDANAAVLYNMGQAALTVGKLAVAEKAFERSVALEPDTPAARELGLLRGQENRFREALVLLMPWARSHPEDTKARLAAAFAAIRLDRPPDAEELLADLPQTDPQVRLAWGNLLLLKNDPSGAVNTLRPLVDAPAGKLEASIQDDARRLLADADLDLGKGADAIAVLKDHAIGPASHLALARAQYQAGDLASALETLRPFAEPILSKSPETNDPRWSIASDIIGDYGRWLVAAGRPADAIPYLRLTTKVRPKEKDVWQALGQALAATGDRDEAQKALQEFQKLAKEQGNQTAQTNRDREQRKDPTGTEIERARKLLEQGKDKEALQLLQSEIELEPKDIRPRLLVSRILLVHGQAQQALQVAQSALDLEPENPDALYQRGTANLALKHLGAAEADLRHALKVAPDHVPAMNDLAVLLLVKGGDRDEARGLLQKVLELRPDDPQAKATLARLDAKAKSGS